MSYKLLVQKEAIIDIQEAFIWYESEQAGLGYELIEEIEYCYQQICEHPQYYGFISKIFCRIILDHFPYRIVYEIEGDTVIINSFDHLKQDRTH